MKNSLESKAYQQSMPFFVFDYCLLEYYNNLEEIKVKTTLLIEMEQIRNDLNFQNQFTDMVMFRLFDDFG